MEKLIRKTLGMLSVIGLTIQAHALHLYGYVEKVRFGPGNAVVKAKLDTGAVSASLYAINAKPFMKNREEWISFDVPLENELMHLKKKLRYYVRIKPRRSEIKKGFKQIAARRPVVSMNLTIGSQTKNIDVNLADRSAFNYPLLLGRKALIRFDIAVDPAQAFVSKLHFSNTKGS